MGANLTILRADLEATARRKWQLLKTPGGAQTALNGGQLSQNILDVSFNEAVEFLDVEPFRKIRVQLWGVASDTNTITAACIGWAASGPGSWMASIFGTSGGFTSAANTGFHATANAHESIRKAFAPGTVYRGCDSIGVTAEYATEHDVDSTAVTPLRYTNVRPVISPQLTVDGNSLVHADFPTFVTIDFSHSRCKYFGLIVSALTGTSAGAIFLPVEYWKE